VPKPIVVGGARELAGLLVRELRAGGDAASVREGSPAGAAALVWIGKADEDALRNASRAKIPLVGVTEGESLPYVLDTSLVVLRRGERLPIDRIARAIAAVQPEGWESLAERLPVLREALVREAIRREARLNAIAAAHRDRARAVPALTLGQMELVRTISSAYGRHRPALAVPRGFAFARLTRRVTRPLGKRLPARPLVRAAVAYALTRAVGEAARWSVRSRS
jgi:hypothetical protein